VNNNHIVNYAYDNDGLLTQAGDLSITYSGLNGLLESADIGNIGNEYSYNGYGELTALEYTDGDQDTLFATDYTLDSLGRITDITEVILGQIKTFSYSYDISGRLVQVDRNGTTISVYTYDDNGNRLFYATQEDTTYGIYDAQDRMLSYGDVTYEYTPNGSLKYKALNGDTTWYTYDLLGNLVNVLLPDGTLIEYLIDGQNRRIGKKVNGEIIKKWLYSNNISPIAELNSNNEVVVRYVYGIKPNVPEYMIKNDSTYRVISDHLGSVRLVVNVATGTINQRIDYDVFGGITKNTNPNFQPFGFAGGFYDNDTKLIRFCHRDYAPNYSRWTAKDPIRFSGTSANLYSYCYNNPVNSIDPLGLRVWYASSCAEEEFIDDIREILKTKKGRELLKRLHARKEIYYIHKGIPGQAEVDPNTLKDIYLDPKFEGEINVRSDEFPYMENVKTTTTRQLAHELGHFIDIEKSEMDVINGWENPVMEPLDGLHRLTYGRRVYVAPEIPTISGDTSKSSNK